MSLVTRIRQEVSDEMTTNQEQLERDRTRRLEVGRIRNGIIDKAVKRLAEKLGEECMELPRSTYGRCYQIGGLVFAVTRNIKSAHETGTETAFNVVVNQYRIGLVGVVVRKDLSTVGESSLTALSFSGIKKTYLNHDKINFDKDAVLRLLTTKYAPSGS